MAGRERKSNKKWGTIFLLHDESVMLHWEDANENHQLVVLKKKDKFVDYKKNMPNI